MRTTLHQTVTFIVWLLAGVAALARDPANVVKIRCGSSVGSGVYLGDRLFLTCAHFCRNEPTRRVTVSSADRFVAACSIVKADARWDQNRDGARRPRARLAACLGNCNPGYGDTVVSAGYEGGAQVQLWQGRGVSFSCAVADGGPFSFSCTGSQASIHNESRISQSGHSMPSCS